MKITYVVDDGSLDDLALLELRDLVEDYDALMEAAMTTKLHPEEAEQLDSLHLYLSRFESQHWIGTSQEAIDIMEKQCDTDFPIIRYLLKHRPDDF